METIGQTTYFPQEINDMKKIWKDRGEPTD